MFPLTRPMSLLAAAAGALASTRRLWTWKRAGGMARKLVALQLWAVVGLVCSPDVEAKYVYYARPDGILERFGVDYSPEEPAFIPAPLPNCLRLRPPTCNWYIDNLMIDSLRGAAFWRERVSDVKYQMRRVTLETQDSVALFEVPSRWLTWALDPESDSFFFVESEGSRHTVYRTPTSTLTSSVVARFTCPLSLTRVSLSVDRESRRLYWVVPLPSEFLVRSQADFMTPLPPEAGDCGLVGSTGIDSPARTELLRPSWALPPPSGGFVEGARVTRGTDTSGVFKIDIDKRRGEVYLVKGTTAIVTILRLGAPGSGLENLGTLERSQVGGDEIFCLAVSVEQCSAFDFDAERAYWLTYQRDPTVTGGLISRIWRTQLNGSDARFVTAVGPPTKTTTTWGPVAAGILVDDGRCTLADALPGNTNPDMDGDGICDRWEVEGVTRDGVFLDLPAMGADPDVKDIFIQVDQMRSVTGARSFAPSQAALDLVVDAFQRAPVDCPGPARKDCKGIRLHIDAGPGFPDRYAGLWGGKSLANTIPYQSWVGLSDAEVQLQVRKWRAEYFLRAPDATAPRDRSGRQGIFRYFIYVDGIRPTDTPLWGQTFGEIGATPMSLLAHIGTGRDRGLDLIRQLMAEGSTFMHELGHQLGLQHGGRDAINGKPNYFSVMNDELYGVGVLRNLEFPLKPRPAGTIEILDYSRYDSSQVADLSESSLDEGKGLTVVDTALGLLVKFYCGSDPGRFGRPAYFNVNGPVDWDCNAGTFGAYSLDLNKDTKLSTMKSYNDWGALRYRAGSVAGYSRGSTEPIAEDSRFRAAALAAQPVSASSADRVFNWAESMFPQFFPSGGVPGTFGIYVYRYYPATGNYVGAGSGRVVVHNGRDWNLLDVGELAEFLRIAVAAGF